MTSFRLSIGPSPVIRALCRASFRRCRLCLRACLFVFLAAGPYVPAALATTETAKVTATDGAAGDQFGNSIAISGDTMIVGAWADDGFRGSAYVFIRSAGVWAQQAKLTASDGAAGDDFGVSVTVSGDTVVVGAEDDDIGPNANQGSAYVFVKPGGGWSDMTQTAKLTASDGAAGDFFGTQVALSGDTVVVGSVLDDIGPNGNQGSAYVFVKPGGGWSDMTQTAKLTASDGAGGDNLGWSAAIFGDTVVAGSWLDDIGPNSNQGSAYVFVKPGGGWSDMTQTAKLTAADGAASDQFGVLVAVSDDTVVVGAYFDDIGPNTDQGSAYVFVKPAGGWSDMTQTAKLTGSDGAGSDNFGVSVAVSDDTVVVSANLDNIGPNVDQGSAYVFIKPGGLWVDMTETDKLTASDGAAGDELGYYPGVAVSGNTVVAGAWHDDIGPNADQGSAYVYDLPSPPLTPPAPHNARKNRYISFAPNNPGTSVAFRVDITSSFHFPNCVGQQRWVGAPNVNGVSRMEAAPVFRVWGEPVIHVGDEEIVPVASHEVRATIDGSQFSTPLVVNTIAKPGVKCWGDVVGDFVAGAWQPPDGLVNGNDTIAVQQGVDGTATRPHFTWTDLDPQIPNGNGTTNVADLFRCVAAFQGSDYPFGVPGCTKFPCGTPPATEACCFSNGTCQNLSSADCTSQSGTSQGAATDCSNYTCNCDMNANSTADVVEAACATCTLMTAGGIDTAAASGTFKIVYLDNTIQTISGLTDPAAVFTRSNPHFHGDATDTGPGPGVPGGGAPPYADTSPIAPNPCVYPPGFPEGPYSTSGPNSSHEMHLEVLDLNLSNGTETIRAGQEMYDSLFAATRTDLYADSFGESQGECIDIPADIFFDMFFEVDLGGGTKLYNKSPVVMRGRLTGDPVIDLSSPVEDFINDPSFPAVALFDANGIHTAYLVSAAFGGGGGGGLPPASCEAQLGVADPLSFSVDGSSNGVLITSPNHVSDDAALPRKKVTVYESSGLVPGNGPDNTNARYANVTGVVGGGSFGASDLINAVSYGRDGTVNLVSAQQIPVLFFSVDRNAQGELCTDVRTEAEKVQVAADVFTAVGAAFGKYASAFAPICVGGRGNCLVTDQSSIGLQPLFGGVGHDNVTALEVARLDPSDDVYMTFAGPSFVGQEARIYRYDQTQPFNATNAVANIFASAGNMGLVSGDIIDAMALSDATPSAEPQQPNGVPDPNFDEVLFSLAPGSPTLNTGGRSAADVFYSDFDGTFTRRATAAGLGLLATDNLDAMDVSPGNGPSDCNANGVSDQCDIDLAAARGEDLDIDDNGIPDTCELRNRYVMFPPDNTTPDIAYRIEKVTAPTGIGWVGAPDASGLADVLPLATPLEQVARTWTQPVVFVGDCEVVPVANYILRGTTDGIVFGPPYEVSTIAKPGIRFWGDTVGLYDGTRWTPPNGTVNVNDYLAALQGFQSLASAPHLTVTDVEAVSITDPCLNRDTNIADVFVLVKAFQGALYPFEPDPTLCPPCP